MSIDVSHKHRVRYNRLSDPSLAGRLFLHEVRVSLLGTLKSCMYTHTVCLIISVKCRFCSLGHLKICPLPTIGNNTNVSDNACKFTMCT